MRRVFASSFTTTRLVMCLARLAYSRELRFSSEWASPGLRHAIMTVTALPPSEFLSRLVSFESRYGTNLLARSTASAVITLRNVNRDLLMKMLSCSPAPEPCPVCAERSEPARSTRVNLDLTTSSGSSGLGARTSRVKSECERLDERFMRWDAITLLRTPFWKCARASSAEAHAARVRPSRWKSRPFAHRIRRPGTPPRPRSPGPRRSAGPSPPPALAPRSGGSVRGSRRSYACSM